MKILYFLDTMQFGGAAKKTTMIANELVRRGNVVSIVTDTSMTIGFKLDDTIQLIPLYADGQAQGNRFLKLFRKLRRVRNIVKSVDPDVVVSVLPHVSFYVKIALIGMKIPIIFSDETSFARKDTRFVHFIRHYFYNLADSVVVLTENDVKLLGDNIPKKVAIHNPVVCPVYRDSYLEKKKTILAIGPLKEWGIKGFDLLFYSFSLVAAEFPDWNIWIAGEDSEPYKSQVCKLILNFGLESRVDLLGHRSDIISVMAKSSIYALSSRVEGFSLSLVEAMSQMCACVAFENHGVIEEVTCGGKGTIIVKDGDVHVFSNALRHLMSDESYRLGLAQEGQNCIHKYGLKTIVDKWTDVIEKVKKC